MTLHKKSNQEKITFIRNVKYGLGLIILGLELLPLSLSKLLNIVSCLLNKLLTVIYESEVILNQVF